jgi:hypothetical protein
MHRRFIAGLAVSAVAAGLLIFDLADRGHVDGWAIALLAFAALPWFWEVIETVSFPGGGIRFRQLIDAQERQADEIRALQFLIAHLLTKDERTHLEKLATRAAFPVAGDAPEPFFTEVHRLRALGFVRGLPDKGISSMRAERGDVRNHFEITDVGQEYLRLVDLTTGD